jgi:hypothetical protein
MRNSLGDKASPVNLVIRSNALIQKVCRLDNPSNRIPGPLFQTRDEQKVLPSRQKPGATWRDALSGIDAPGSEIQLIVTDITVFSPNQSPSKISHPPSHSYLTQICLVAAICENECLCFGHA